MESNWFALPSAWLIHKPIPVNQFFTSGMDKQKKKKLRQSIKSIQLMGQIAGEEIPSLINEDINCQVILFLSVTVNDRKDMPSVGTLLQESIKPFSVIMMEDIKGNTSFCFALKRLHRQDKEQILLEHGFFWESSELKPNLPFLYEHIHQRTNKYLFYLELYTRHFILARENSWSGLKTMQETHLFSSADHMVKLIQLVDQIYGIIQQVKAVDELSEKTKLNKTYKEIIQALEQWKAEVN
jgi:hypothetical protein